jgi:hypothetical protein
MQAAACCGLSIYTKSCTPSATVASLKEGLLFYRRHRENHLKYQSAGLPAQQPAHERQDTAMTA